MSTTVFERSRPDPRIVAAALDGSRLSPFWIDDLRVRASFPRYSGGRSVELAVVGGGYTGLWTALQAKQRDSDARVVILEAKAVGWAASGRNGGFCEATLTHGEVNGENRFPRELEQLDRLGRENLDEIESTVRELGLDCDFERTGSLAVAIEDYQLEEIRAAHNGETERFFDAEAMRAELDSPTYLGGLWSTRATAMVHPAKLAAELARACLEAGVEIFEHSPVTALDSELRGGPVTVLTAGGFVTADRVALATNAFPSLLKRYRLHTVPVYDYVLMTEPLSAAQLASIGWKNRQGVSDLGNQFHYYRLSRDNRILWGGCITTQTRDPVNLATIMRRRIVETYPQLGDLKVAAAWSGLMSYARHLMPQIGRMPDGLWYATGFGGHGMNTTAIAGRVVAEAIAGESDRIKLFQPFGLDWNGGPFGRIAVQATYWYLQAMDAWRERRNPHA